MAGCPHLVCLHACVSYLLELQCVTADGETISTTVPLVVERLYVEWLVPPPRAMMPASTALSQLFLEPPPTLALVNSSGHRIDRLLSPVSCALNATAARGGGGSVAGVDVALVGATVQSVTAASGAHPTAVFSGLQLTGGLGTDVSIGAVCSTVSEASSEVSIASLQLGTVVVEWVAPLPGSELLSSSPLIDPAPRVQVTDRSGGAFNTSLACTLHVSEPAPGVALEGIVQATAAPHSGTAEFSGAGLVAPFGAVVRLAVRCAWLDGQTTSSPLRTVSVRAVDVHVAALPSHALAATPLETTLRVTNGAGTSWSDTWPRLSCGVAVPAGSAASLVNPAAACAEVHGGTVSLPFAVRGAPGTAVELRATCSAEACGRLDSGSTAEITLPVLNLDALHVSLESSLPRLWPPSSATVALPIRPAVVAQVTNSSGLPLVGVYASGTFPGCACVCVCGC